MTEHKHPISYEDFIAERRKAAECVSVRARIEKAIAFADRIRQQPRMYRGEADNWTDTGY